MKYDKNSYIHGVALFCYILLILKLIVISMKRLLFILLLFWGAGNLAYPQYRGPITPPPLLKENFENITSASDEM